MQARRHQYLKAMGIQAWQPRADSAAVACLDEPMPNDLLTAETAADSCLKSMPVQSQEHDSSLSSYNPPVQQTEQTFVGSGTPEFRFASIIFPESCLVVAQVPLQISEPVGPEHITYLKNLLFALELDASEEPQITLFNWPMLRSANFDQGAAAAMEASQAFLRAQKARFPVPVTLLMGEEAGRYLMPAANSFAIDRGRLTDHNDEIMLLTESIERVFSDVQLKADVWRDLQVLRGTLAS